MSLKLYLFSKSYERRIWPNKLSENDEVKINAALNDNFDHCHEFPIWLFEGKTETASF